MIQSTSENVLWKFPRSRESLMSPNPNDEIREKMLRYFYDRNANATSERGKRGSQVRISDVKSELKDLHGLTRQQVMSNLSYMIDSGWVERLEVERSIRTRRGTQQPSTQFWYKITNTGIDLIEGESSAFQRSDPFAGINIMALGSTVQVGDGNYANSQFNGLASDLDALREELVASTKLDEPTKVSAAADIQTLQMQIAKPKPNRTIVREALSGIKEVANIAGLAARFAGIADHLPDFN